MGEFWFCNTNSNYSLTSFRLYLILKFSIMDIHSEKLNLIHWISALSDEKIIDTLIAVKEQYASNKDSLQDFASDEIASINSGLNDIKEGNTHEDTVARKVYEKYL